MMEMNPFSDSTILWSILVEYGPFEVLCWYCKGPLSGSYYPKIGQNYMQYDLWALIVYLHFMKVKNEYDFW